MWYYVLTCCVGAAFLAWVGFIVGVEVGQRRGYSKGRQDALAQVRQMVDKHQVKDVNASVSTSGVNDSKKGQKESPSEFPKTPEPPLFPILPQP